MGPRVEFSDGEPLLWAACLSPQSLVRLTGEKTGEGEWTMVTELERGKAGQEAGGADSTVRLSPAACGKHFQRDALKRSLCSSGPLCRVHLWARRGETGGLRSPFWTTLYLVQDTTGG